MREASEPVATKGSVVIDVVDMLLDVVLLRPELVDGGFPGVLLSSASEIRTGGRQ